MSACLTLCPRCPASILLAGLVASILAIGCNSRSQSAGDIHHPKTDYPGRADSDPVDKNAGQLQGQNSAGRVTSAKSANVAWRSFQSPRGEFKASFPGPVQLDRDGDRHVYHVTTAEDVDFCVSLTLDVRLAIAQVNRDKLLDSLVDALASQRRYKLVQRGSVTISGFPGREVIFHDRDSERFDVYRVFLTRGHTYLLWVNGSRRQSAPKIQQFFNSFAVLGETSASPSMDGSKQAVRAAPQTISQQLQSDDPKVVSETLQQLAAMEPGRNRKQRATEIALFLEHETFYVRTAAVEALKKWATADSLPVLVECLADESFVVRHTAIETLAGFPSTEVASEIAAVFPANRIVAKAALEQIGAPAEAAVWKLLESPEWPVRKDALDILMSVGTEASTPRLQRIAQNDENGLVRKTAEKALQALHPQPR